MTAASPTVRQRELGPRLRQLRDEHSLTVEEVAMQFLCSPTKIRRVETGARRATLRDIRGLRQLYEVGTKAPAELMDLARGARQQGWWTKYDDLKISPFIGMEQAAAAITCFGMCFAPAMLQTEDYAREIIERIAPKTGPDIFRQRVEARMIRQGLLRPKQSRYRALLDEAVLHRQAGGPSVMKAKLKKTLLLIRAERAAVQVIPYEMDACAGLDSNFDCLEPGGSTLPGLVFVEGLVGHLYLERPDESDRYRETLEYLRDEALNPRDSLRFNEEVRSRVTGSYKRRRANLKREEAERREREEAERRKDWLRTAVKALIVGGEIIVTLIREHLFMGTGPGRLL